MSKRYLVKNEAKNLAAGDDHYTAFVGPPDQYGFMGATQFCLLISLGLQDHHKLLDFGCGSLRAGRMLIPYLDRKLYFGIDPNRWLIEDAISNELGEDIIDIKEPSFLYHDTFSCTDFNEKFDFILAQSIFSHTGIDLLEYTLSQFKLTLKEDGLIAATFILATPDHPEFLGRGWVYPGCVRHKPETIINIAASCGLAALEIPWYHPRQKWFILSHETDRLPTQERLVDLRGQFMIVPSPK